MGTDNAAPSPATISCAVPTRGAVPAGTSAGTTASVIAAATRSAVLGTTPGVVLDVYAGRAASRPRGASRGASGCLDRGFEPHGCQKAVRSGYEGSGDQVLISFQAWRCFKHGTVCAPLFPRAPALVHYTSLSRRTRACASPPAVATIVRSDVDDASFYVGSTLSSVGPSFHCWTGRSSLNTPPLRAPSLRHSGRNGAELVVGCARNHWSTSAECA